jgi:fucose permease
LLSGERAQGERYRTTILLLHAGFVLTGVVNIMLGPLLPLLSARWALTDAQAGFFFTAQFLGSICGVLASSLLIPRRGHRLCLMLGFGMMALGSATLVAASWRLGLPAAFALGIGLGLAIPATNLVISVMHPEKRAAALNLINLSWGVGAVACPLLLSALLRRHPISFLLEGLAALLLLSIAGCAAVSFPVISAPEQIASPTKAIWRGRWIFILGAIFFLYVGSEGAVSGWIATYAKRTSGDGGAGATWLLMPSFFWGSLLLGRASAPWCLRYVQDRRLAQLGLIVSAAGIVFLLAAKSLPAIALGAILAGLGFSSVFPFAIASLARHFGARESQVAGPMFALAGAGGATLPWLAGYFSTTFGALRYGLAVPLLGCILLLALNAQPPSQHD